MSSKARAWATSAAVTALVLFLAYVPRMDFSTGGLLPHNLNSPGSLQILALIFATAALATTYDILIGYNGLLNLGHTLYFAISAYAFTLILTHSDLGFLAAGIVGVVVCALAAAVTHALALRTVGIAYVMVTLAFGQFFFIFVTRNYFGTGGEQGLSLPYEKLPDSLRGIANTENLYWIALTTLVLIVGTVKLFTMTRLGRVWKAVGENPLRVAVMGANVYAHQWVASMISAVLAGVCGITYALVMGGVESSMISLTFSVGLMIMVVLGGAGRVWGATMGACLYVFLEQRLPVLADSTAVSSLPQILRLPLSQPEALLGVVFILLVLFVPGGLSSLAMRSLSRSKLEGGGSVSSTVPAPVDARKETS